MYWLLLKQTLVTGGLSSSVLVSFHENLSSVIFNFVLSDFIAIDDLSNHNIGSMTKKIDERNYAILIM